MSEVADMVMPVLQSIQSRLGGIERDLADVKADVKRIWEVHGQKLEDIEIHLGYLTGVESQNKFDLHRLRQRLKVAEDKLQTLEPQP